MHILLRETPNDPGPTLRYVDQEGAVTLTLSTFAAIDLGGGEALQQVAVHLIPVVGGGHVLGDRSDHDRLEQLIYWAIRTKEAQDDGGQHADSDADAEYSREHLLALMKTFVD